MRAFGHAEEAGDIVVTREPGRLSARRARFCFTHHGARWPERRGHERVAVAETSARDSTEQRTSTEHRGAVRSGR